MTDYEIRLLREPEGYQARIPDLPGCSARGRSPEEALASLKAARAAWIRSARQEGRPVPAPSTPPGADARDAAAATGGTRPEDRIGLDPALLHDFCQRWKIRRFWLFGSVLHKDFGPASDVDVLVRFQPGASWSLFHLGDMEEELEGWFGRPVDLVDVEALSNPIRRAHILTHRTLVYEAR